MAQSVVLDVQGGESHPSAASAPSTTARHEGGTPVQQDDRTGSPMRARPYVPVD
jgi:hypothetical protein